MTDQAQVGVAIEVGFLQGQALRQTDIVAVHAGHILAPALLHGKIHGLHHAAVGAVENANPGIPGSVSPKQGKGVVKGPVVDGHDLEVFPGLGQQAVQTGFKAVPGIVARQRDGYHVLPSLMQWQWTRTAFTAANRTQAKDMKFANLPIDNFMS